MIYDTLKHYPQWIEIKNTFATLKMKITQYLPYGMLDRFLVMIDGIEKMLDTEISQKLKENPHIWEMPKFSKDLKEFEEFLEDKIVDGVKKGL